MARAALTATDTASATGQSAIVGDVVTIATVVTVGSVATDPTAITLTIQNPDLSITTVSTPTHDSTGNYHYDFTPAGAGHYVYRWVGTGAAAGAAEGAFDVEAAYAGSVVVDLEALKTQLNITSTTADAELQRFLDAAVAVAEDVVGKIAPRTVSNELHDGGSGIVILRQWPVVSVTTVTEYNSGTAQVLAAESTTVSSSYDYLADLDAGVIYRRASYSSLPFGAGRRNIAVTYVAGYSPVPANIRQGVLYIVEHLWQSQRGGRVVAVGQPFEDAMSMTPAGFAIPNRALELLSPSRRPHAIA